MDSEIQRWLKETYYGKSRVSKYVGDEIRYDKPAKLTDAEWKELCASPFPPNAFESADHDEIVERIIAADAELEWEDVCDGFVLGCLGIWQRGLQTAISSAFARNLEPHGFVAATRHRGCDVCAIPPRESWDRSDQVFRCYWGYAWNESPWHYVAELEERLHARAPEPTRAQRDAFTGILRAIDAAPEGETPGELAKRLGRAKLPKTDKYRRFGILVALAELGVMPSTIPGSYDALVRVGDRQEAEKSLRGSSLPMPLAAWRGDGIDWTRAEELFGI